MRLVEGDTFNLVVAVLPLRPAVSVASTVLVVDPAVAAKTAFVLPAATVTLAGTVTVVLLLESETTVPLVGASPLMVTEQTAIPGPVTVPGRQPRLVT